MMKLNEFGEIESLHLGGRNIPFRSDYYKGPSVLIEREKREEKAIFAKRSEDYFAEFYGLELCKMVKEKADVLQVTLCLENTNCVEDIERLFFRIGIDCFMDTFPEWNEKYFPTMLKNEETHFVGYLQTPTTNILGVCGEEKISSWQIDYNRADYGGENHVGHRIYTFSLDLEIPKLGETKAYSFYFKPIENEHKLFDFFFEYSKSAIIKSKKWTYEKGETLEVTSNGELEIFSPTNKAILNGSVLREYGTYTVLSRINKTTTGHIHVRRSLFEYLDFAAKAVFMYPQKASTHCETYYGYFSGFAYAKRSNDKSYLKKLKKNFGLFLSVMLDKNCHMVAAADPERVQNISSLISILVDAYECTRQESYLKKADILARDLIASQSLDGAYRCGWNNAHYTCVVYPAKSLLELYLVTNNKMYYESAKKAVDNLYQLLDNIQTEGEQTFEDGMISCESLQLAFFALQLQGAEQKRYSDTAEHILDKHACLEQRYIWDTKQRGCTLRFWETMYDVLISRNMINSPHGWTSWKTYATYYLYLLTGKLKYLTDTMDTLCACLQCVDLENEKLYWAYIADPKIKTNVFVQRGESNFGELIEQVVGGGYLDMISSWWQSDSKKVVKGFANPMLGRVDDFYKGGCCDNDVHEHFKCLDEIGFTAFLHENENGELITYNCQVIGGEVVIEDKYIDAVHAVTSSPCDVKIFGEIYKLEKACNRFIIKGGKRC